MAAALPLDSHQSDRAQHFAITSENRPHLEDSFSCFRITKNVPGETEGACQTFIADQSSRLEQTHRCQLNFPNFKAFRLQQLAPLRNRQRSDPVMNDSRQRAFGFLANSFFEMV